MKAISYGKTYEIHDDTLKTYDQLPVKTYIVRFNNMTGFYLEEYSDLEIKEDKIYGVHNAKVQKVLKSFDRFKRNLGVILSGQKGIGKSLFAKLLCSKAIEKGLPVIIVDSFIPGIASYIEKIEQEVVVLFDEFDKTFGNIRTGENEADPQAGLLSLFDGVAHGKKLFVITCNELSSLNDYFVNRPGRFHYHFRFDYPSPEEIKEYLKDKLEPEYYDEIDKVIRFSRKVSLNFDCLRAIAYELNTGEEFKDAIKDLNIINTNTERYNVVLYFKNGVTMYRKDKSLDLFSDETESLNLFDSERRAIIEVNFRPADCTYDFTKGAQIVPGDKLILTYSDYYEDEIIEKIKPIQADYLEIKRCFEKNIHYVV